MILGMVAMSVEQFEELVANALDGIPAELGEAMENVAVMVDDHSPPGRLLGLYQGVPLTSRGAHYSARIGMGVNRHRSTRHGAATPGSSSVFARLSRSSSRGPGDRRQI
jgi:predicted Zn-dependent protease with MMP-like domain